MIKSSLLLFFCLPVAEVFLTAFQALVWNARMKDGETVLVHAVRELTCVVVVGSHAAFVL